MRSGPPPRAAGAAGRCARSRLTWSQCPSCAASCGRTLFIGLGGNLGEPCVLLASRERRGHCRRGGTWLLAAWLILSRQVPSAAAPDRHESRLALSRLARSLAGSLARPPARASLLLRLLRLPLLPPPAPDQFAAVGTGSAAAGEWRGKSECAAVSGRGAAGAGLRREAGLGRRRVKMIGGAAAAGRGAGPASPARLAGPCGQPL